jgi:hypothetical protein
MGGQASPCSTGFRRRSEQSPGGGCGDRHATCDWSRLDDLRVDVQAQYFAAQGMPVGRKLARSHERDTSAAHCSGENSILTAQLKLTWARLLPFNYDYVILNQLLHVFRVPQ